MGVDYCEDIMALIILGILGIILTLLIGTLIYMLDAYDDWYRRIGQYE
jgi:hypothetical protein